VFDYVGDIKRLLNSLVFEDYLKALLWVHPKITL
jgi:hypothetical protein